MLIMTPPRRFSSGKAYLAQSHGPFRLTSKTRENSAEVNSSIGLNGAMAALLTRISRPPRCCTVRAIMSWTAASSATSARMTTHRRPSALISCSVCAALSMDRPAIRRSAPSRAMARAMAWPMPRKPPVITATLPCSFIFVCTPSLRLCRQTAAKAALRRDCVGAAPLGPSSGYGHGQLKGGLPRQRPPFLRRTQRREHDVQHMPSVGGTVDGFGILPDTIHEVSHALKPVVAPGPAQRGVFHTPATAWSKDVDGRIGIGRVARQGTVFAVHFQGCVAASLDAPRDIEGGEKASEVEV